MQWQMGSIQTRLYWRPTAPRFFARAARELSDAILDVGDN
jgi:hypothetical protein